jgi:two-component system, chemotaxis family, sensor kinase CheA
MDKDELLQRLLGTFLAELEEHVHTLNHDLLALEQQSDPAVTSALLATMFRAAHSLKGAARSVDVGPIEAACHRLETILAAVREERLKLTAEVTQLLFESVDAIQDAGKRLQEKRDLDSAPVTALLPRLEAAMNGGAVAETPTKSSARLRRAAPSAPKASAEPGKSPAGASAMNFARVPAEKLDALLAHNGELLVARRRAGAWQDQLLELRTLVARWRGRWSDVERSLRRLTRADDEASTRFPSAPADDLPADLPRSVVQALGSNGDHLRQLERGLERLGTGFAEDQRALERAALALEEDIRRVRMLPFREACEGLQRTVRDLATAQGKEVELLLPSEAVELDRSILERLKDPLLHLVRNALDHAIEPPAQRRKAGKAGRGHVTVAAALHGSQVEVIVEDDGKGLDVEAIAEQVRRRGLVIPGDMDELHRLIFLPGFSTSRLITEVSGRGVGLDVVKTSVESVHGTVSVASTPGQGTRFTLTVPLTLTTLRGLLVEAGGQVLAFAGTNVKALLRVGLNDIHQVEGREMVRHDDRLVPLASLAELLGLRGSESAGPQGLLPVVIAAAGERQAAFTVDALLEEQEITVKSLGPRLVHIPHVAGASTLASGRIALILNAGDLVRHALGQSPSRRLTDSLAKPAQEARRRLLLVEDSVTTRALEKSILEAAGFEVLIAANGEDAWHILQAQGADLVVTDVEMPRMDGFALTEAIRGSKRFREMPVILVTALESDKDKARGIEVGADAYLLKSGFNQQRLLETIGQLL